MILTVTLNPLLENKLYFKNITESPRAYNQEYLAGGKGINISRQLNRLGIKNHAITYLGGYNGKRLRAILEKEKISFSAVSTKAETREASLIFDESQSKLKTYFGVNGQILNSEVEHFFNKLEKAIINASVVIFAGSLPSENTSIIIEKGVELCNKYDKISILDSYGDYLSKVIFKGPTIIHNNKVELENSLNINLSSMEKKKEILKKFYEGGTNLAFITDGPNDVFASKADFHYQITVPKIKQIDATGSGDAFVAGIVYGLEKQMIFNDFVKLGISIGALNAESWSTCSVEFNNIKKYTDQIEIKEIGKKIKIIDDSPTI